MFAVVPLAALLLFGPQIAKLYFGPAYKEAGVYMQIVTFWMFFQFINSPISATFTIIDKQQIGFYLILLSLFLRLGAMMVFSDSARIMLSALSISAGMFYLTYNVAIYYFIKKIE